MTTLGGQRAKDLIYDLKLGDSRELFSLTKDELKTWPQPPQNHHHHHHHHKLFSAGTDSIWILLNWELGNRDLRQGIKLFQAEHFRLKSC